MERKKVEVVLLTGGSSGIGAATSLMLASAGMKVYAASRSGRAPSHPLIVPVGLDVNDEEATRALVEEIVSREGHLDAVVANAGNGIAGPIENTSDEEVRYQFETCFFGSTKTIRSVLPQMRRQGYGRIVTVSSVAGFIPIPYQAIYSSAKAALLILTQALSLEVAPFGIQCGSVLPGDTKTGFTSARKKIASVDPSYEKTFTESVGKMEKDEQNGMPPEAIARAILRQLQRRRMKPSVTPGFTYKAIRVLEKIVPEKLMLWIVSLLYA